MSARRSILWAAVATVAMMAVLAFGKGTPRPEELVFHSVFVFFLVFLLMQFGTAFRMRKALPKAVFVMHHDNPPRCTARLVDGYCPVCGFSPQSPELLLYTYCPKCDIEVRFDITEDTTECPQCGQTLARPRTYQGMLV